MVFDSKQRKRLFAAMKATALKRGQTPCGEGHYIEGDTFCMLLRFSEPADNNSDLLNAIRDACQRVLKEQNIPASVYAWASYKQNNMTHFRIRFIEKEKD